VQIDFGYFKTMFVVFLHAVVVVVVFVGHVGRIIGIMSKFPFD
jgi:hypothetical protein